MGIMTLAEVQTELSLVNIAIQDVIAGNRINEHKLATGEFARWYKFTDTSLESLNAYRRELLNLLSTLEPAALPVFRANANIPLIVRKD
jgi:hypothetical protein